nr:hypothetical protein [uncultured Ruminococcus sp.]
MEYSLFYPPNAEKRVQKLTAESINDLSIDFLLNALTENRNERDHMRKLMTCVTDDPDVIRYRCDVFEDFLRFPELRSAMEELVVELAELRDLEKFQKDQDSSAFWSLVNRLREVDEYVRCISMLKEILDNLDIRSEGMLTLRKLVTDISAESGFPELRADIDETKGVWSDATLYELRRQEERAASRHQRQRHPQLPSRNAAHTRQFRAKDRNEQQSDRRPNPHINRHRCGFSLKCHKGHRH